MLAEVVFPIPIDRVFHYQMPGNGSASPTFPKPGFRVNVPFGRRKRLGLVVGYSETSPEFADRLKPIESIVDPEPVLDEEMIDLARWLSERYACSLGESIFSLLPGRSTQLKSDKRKTETISSTSFPVLSTPPLMLTPDQQKALSGIEKSLEIRKHQVFLLWGVAAAGKTEIYMKAIEKALSLGGGAVYLVPEISLTAQVLPELERRFPGQVVVWHSGVSASAKKEAWRELNMGQRRIVLGARSAVVAPVKDLSLIVMDEEHDPLYKEDSKPRYHARGVALERTRRSGACLVLGSATPSLESYKAVLEGSFELVELPERILGSTPALRLVDMKREKRDTVLSGPLKSAIAERLKKREQVILFLNRRGFYTFCLCPKCGWVFRCPSCDVPLVMHKDKKMKKDKVDSTVKTQSLRCHYCIYRSKIPESCPACQHKSLWMGGMGTERVFSEIEKEFPWAHVVRWDLESVGRKKAHGEIFESVKSGAVDIVVGTQMVSQGLDLPGVTLMGVVDADVVLHRPDFRAGERTFQLLVQAAGRAGRRDVQGEVIIQTRQPDHPALSFAKNMDYIGFARFELEHRKELNYPPYARLAQLVFSGSRASVVEKEAQEFLVWFGSQPFSRSLQALGPAPAQRARRAGKIRVQVLMKGLSPDFENAASVVKGYRPRHGARLLIDVDPEELR